MRSRQWLRELRRGKTGQRLVAVELRIAGATPVVFGRDNAQHGIASVDNAVATLLKAADPSGFEACSTRAIELIFNTSEINSIRPLRRLTDWLFFPEAKGPPPSAAAALASGAKRASGGEPFSRRLRVAD